MTPYLPCSAPRSEVFTDYLSTTCKAEPDLSFAEDVEFYVAAWGFLEWRKPSPSVIVYLHPRYGTRQKARVVVTRSKQYHQVSVGGEGIRALRDLGVWHDFLSVLGSVPHTVTRIDPACDLAYDGADAHDVLYGRLGDSCRLVGRKALPVDHRSAQRPWDGRMTGTTSIGIGTQASCKLRVYDKAWEQYCKWGISMTPTTRVEAQCGRDYRGKGLSLRDAAEPESLFYDAVPADILSRPAGVAPWVPAAEPWVSSSKGVEPLPADVAARRIAWSPELDLLMSIADRMGEGGRVWLVREFAKRVGVEVHGSLSRRSEALLGDSEEVS